MSAIAFRYRPAVSSLESGEVRERWVRRRVGTAWCLLWFNTMTYLPGSILHIPSIIGKGISQGALPIALLVALSVNPKARVRPNVYLFLLLLLVLDTVISCTMAVGLGTIFRTVRLAEFVLALWLLTPWWGRQDMLLLRWHLRCLVVALASVVLGLMISPSHAYLGGRLDGAIWPMTFTQVAQYGGVLAGLVVVLWLGRLLSGRAALVGAIFGVVMIILAHTRTALVGLAAGVIVAGLSLFTVNARVRKFFAAGALTVSIAIMTAAGFLASWLARGEGTAGLETLTGRTNFWALVIAEPRNAFQQIFGFGLSNASVNGLPIDSNWLSSYQQEGLLGVTLCALIILFLLIYAFFRPPGVQRAVALFLVTYCLLASFTEDSFSDASTYMLHLTIAASLLCVPVAQKVRSSARSLPAGTQGPLEYADATRPKRPAQHDGLSLRQPSALTDGDLILGVNAPFQGTFTWRPAEELEAGEDEIRDGAWDQPAAVAEQQIQARRYWRVARQVSRRLSWGVADQAVSSLTNFLLSIYVARSLGAAQFGAFALAYVTYGFAINASRGLSIEPLLIRFSGSDLPTWRRAAAGSTGTALLVGVATGICAIAAGRLVGGTTGLALVALGLTLPGLMLQDSWRYAFFALGRGHHTFINDTVWAVILFPTLALLRVSGHASVFSFIVAWGGAAAAAAAIGPLQAGVMPSVRAAREWLTRHRDLGPRYLAENAGGNAADTVRSYSLSSILGLAAVGYIQAANTLMGPFKIIYFGISLITLPEATRILRKSPRQLPLFCVAVSAGLGVLAVAWTALLLVAMPRGLGHMILGGLWVSTYPLVLPAGLAITSMCANTGAMLGLHALGSARRSMRVTILIAVLVVGAAIAGAFTGGIKGTMYGAAAAMWVGTLMSWWELRKALQESDIELAFGWPWPGRSGGHHRSRGR
jgi:O-antigen/teichoic acid export membrane protein